MGTWVLCYSMLRMRMPGKDGIWYMENLMRLTALLSVALCCLRLLAALLALRAPIKIEN